MLVRRPLSIREKTCMWAEAVDDQVLGGGGVIALKVQEVTKLCRKSSNCELKFCSSSNIIKDINSSE